MRPDDYVHRYQMIGWELAPVRADNPRAPKHFDWPDRPGTYDLSKLRHGAFLVCGKRSGVSVIDIDDPDMMDEFAPLVIGKTPYARTPKGGAHILVSYSSAEWWGNQVKYVPGIDLRNDRGGIALPFLGNDGRFWAPKHAPWEQDLALPGPFEKLLQELSGKSDEPTPGEGSSNLNELLQIAPKGEGSRNSWLASVAGHLAPMIDYEDAFLALINRINLSLDSPLPRTEVYKTVGRMWARDRERNPVSQNTDQPWAVVDGILKYYKGKGNSRDAYDWISPAIEVVEYRHDSEGNASWKIRQGHLDTVVSSAEVYNNPKTGVALSRVEAVADTSVVSPKPHSTEFYRWLMANSPDPIRQVPHWGWNDELQQWVGLEGNAVGPEEYQPEIGEVTRLDIIEQLPTWQEDQVAAVFCSWVALQVAKGVIEMTIEPNIVLQGAAGSGKTRGLFAFGSRLTGSTRVASGTIASIRDRIAGHRNGIVVIDDHASLEGNSTKLLELYRVSTSGESLSLKMQTPQGWAERRIPLLGSILASGENLSDLSDDRALRDRSVILEVPPASGRMSIADPKRSQWSEIESVFRGLGGTDESVAHQLAGPFIRRILEVAKLESVVSNGSGERVAVKLALIRHGAKLWQAAFPNSRTYEGWTVVEAVDMWCEVQSQSSGWQDTTLMRKILPAMVDPTVGELQAIGIDEDNRVWFHVERLSRAWCRDHRNARDQEVGSIANIRREVLVLQKAKQAEKTTQRVFGKPTSVRRLTPAASAVILREAGLEPAPDGTLPLS